MKNSEFARGVPIETPMGMSEHVMWVRIMWADTIFSHNNFHHGKLNWAGTEMPCWVEMVIGCFKH